MLNVKFNLDDATIAKLKGRVQQYCVEFIQDVNEQVVEATPVKTGFLRNSWYAGLNTEPPAPGGSGGVATMNVVAADLKLGDVYNAVNGAVYAARIEFGFVGKDSLGRNINQRPRAFIRSVIDRADAIAAAAAARVAST
jgi:hypothetical protein